MRGTFFDLRSVVGCPPRANPCCLRKMLRSVELAFSACNILDRNRKRLEKTLTWTDIDIYGRPRHGGHSARLTLNSICCL